MTASITPLDDDLASKSMSRPDGLPVPQRYFATLAIAASMVLVVIDGAIANVALPTISASLGVTASASVWVVSSYQMALVMTLLPSAALGESIGLRRAFCGGVVVFTAASLLCTLAPSLTWLVAARFLQGIGAAAVMSLGISFIRFTFPQRLLGAALGWNAMLIALSGAAAPAIGSAILMAAGWRWLFVINLPVCVVVLAAAWALPGRAGSGRAIDIVSVGLNATAFALLILGIDQVTQAPGSGGLMLVTSICCFVTLVRREIPKQAPLIPLDLLRNYSFRTSILASICCFAGQMASFIALPFYFQHSLGQNAFTTGLYLTSWPLVVAIAGPLSGRFADRVSNGALCAVGGALLAAGLGLCAVWPAGAGIWAFVPFLMLAGFGFGLFQTPNNRNMLMSVSYARTGAAGGMQGTARLIGQTIGSMIMVLLFARTSAAVAPQIGLWVSAALALTGGVISLSRAHPRILGDRMNN